MRSPNTSDQEKEEDVKICKTPESGLGHLVSTPWSIAINSRWGKGPGVRQTALLSHVVDKNRGAHSIRRRTRLQCFKGQIFCCVEMLQADCHDAVERLEVLFVFQSRQRLVTNSIKPRIGGSEVAQQQFFDLPRLGVLCEPLQILPPVQIRIQQVTVTVQRPARRRIEE